MLPLGARWGLGFGGLAFFFFGFFFLFLDMFCKINCVHEVPLPLPLLHRLPSQAAAPPLPCVLKCPLCVIPARATFWFFEVGFFVAILGFFFLFY